MTHPSTVADTLDARHTPGPFAVHPANAWIVCEQLDAHGQPCPVAALAWPTEYRSEAETWANAHLFAAAPDLLNVLAMAVAEIEAARPMMIGSAAIMRRAAALGSTCDYARRVIAKARGEEQP